MSSATIARPGARPGATAKADPAPALRLPFTRAAHQRIEPATDNSYTMTGAQQLIGPLDVPSFGWLRDLILYVTCTTAGNSANTAFKEDGPWSVIAEIVLNDVNGGPLTGPIAGFELYLISKWGGYDFDCDPTRSVLYSTTTGTGATGGSFSFMIKLPVEITERDALGSLANQNAAGTYKLRITAAASTDVYQTPPTALGTVRIRTFMETWTPPLGADPLRDVPQETAPPAEGTTQYWSKQVVNVAAASQTIRLTKVGNLIRNLILVYRDTTPARSTTNFPADVQLIWDGLTLMNVNRDVWRAEEQARYGLAAASVDTGVFVLDFTHDFDGHPGGEQRDLYLPTTQATNLVVQGTFGAAGTLVVLTNDVAPGGRNNPIAGSS